nr:hypothetical protein L203_02594 [Cryptococcus depauperatus CBS 7841]
MSSSWERGPTPPDPEPGSNLSASSTGAQNASAPVQSKCIDCDRTAAYYSVPRNGLGCTHDESSSATYVEFDPASTQPFSTGDQPGRSAAEYAAAGGSNPNSRAFDGLTPEQRKYIRARVISGDSYVSAADRSASHTSNSPGQQSAALSTASLYPRTDGPYGNVSASSVRDEYRWPTDIRSEGQKERDGSTSRPPR